jgi:hypothetical protein
MTDGNSSPQDEGKASYTPKRANPVSDSYAPTDADTPGSDHHKNWSRQELERFDTFNDFIALYR